MSAAGRIPVILVTGFLGSGKTTLIAAILSQPGFDRTLVVVNEFGEVGIDHDLLEASSEDVVLLANGCLCCTIRGNLVDTLIDAQAQAQAGRLRRFERVVIETSGLADPAPVLGFVLGDARWQADYVLTGVVTVCDGLAGLAALDRFPEAVSQASLADRLVITKGDIAPRAAVDALRARLRTLNPGADILEVSRGAIEARRILDLDRPAAEENPPPPHRHDDDDAADRALRRHGMARRRYLVTPLDQAGLERLTAALRDANGPDLLRIKGLLRLQGDARIALIQGAMTGLAPPELRAMTMEGPGRLVLLGREDALGRADRALAPFLDSIQPPDGR
ncbi:MAG: GTP-binding protein [Alphaproteobacteria bacterium]|nr:GTP-binding protein [Alphaproteobacteria bacterium]